MDKFGRASKEDLNMAIAFTLCARSIDPNTKHGCYIVDEDNRPLTLGYNGPIRGSIDDNVSLQTPQKYDEIEHAERNAIYNAGRSLKGATAYITGYPCIDCFRGLAQSGVTTIVYGPIPSKMMTEDKIKTIRKMLVGLHIDFIEYKGDPFEVPTILERYLATKDIKRKYNRDALGKVVRTAWMNEAKHDTLPYDELAEEEKEIERRIGEAVIQAFLSGELNGYDSRL